MNVECNDASIATNDAQVLVRPKSDLKHILSAQDLNGQGKYLAVVIINWKYLQRPKLISIQHWWPLLNNNLRVPNYGTLSVIPTDNFLASIYREQNGKLQMIERFEINGKNNSYKLQPGQYRIVYKSKKNYRSESTHSQQFTIDEGKTAVLNL